ncbi:MAG: hypothetical protein VB859_14400, partial [Planctomycetaceae bacterium]
NRTAGKRNFPMRSVTERRFGYIFNAWSDGKTQFRNESQSGLTMNAMKKAAANNPEIAARVRLFLYRTTEELYDYENDPDALRNLADDPAHQQTLRRLRLQLQQHMTLTNDPQLAVFRRQLLSP